MTTNHPKFAVTSAALAGLARSRFALVMSALAAAIGVHQVAAATSAPPITAQPYIYTDAALTQIPFTYGRDTASQYNLQFPASVSTAQQMEILALPQFGNNGSGAAQIVTVGPMFPPGPGAPSNWITSDVAESANFNVAAANYGTMFQVTTGASNVTATLPAATTVPDGFYFFIRKTDSGAGLVLNSALSDSVSNQGHVTAYWSDGTAWYGRAWYGSTDASGDLNITTPGYVKLGTGPLLTTATTGFPYIPSGAGTPTGVPVTVTGHIPLYVDSTNDILYFYAGGNWIASGASVPFANPTGLVGPTATNGVSTSAMRADAAPAINLAASYTWITGTHTFNGTFGGTGVATYLLSPPPIGSTAPNTIKGTTISGSQLNGTAGDGAIPIAGTNTNDSAAAGNVGEYIAPAVAGPTSINTATITNLITQSLTAGDWDVQEVVTYSYTTATTAVPSAANIAAVGTTSVTLGTTGTVTEIPLILTAASQVITVASPVVRVSLSATSNVYGYGYCVFSAGSCTTTAFLRARRVR